MDEQKKEVSEKIKTWLKNPGNLILVGILILAFCIRLYYFIQTSNQAVWWDEASYGTIAKNMIDGRFQNADVLVRELIIRAPFLPFLWSLFLRLNLSEIIVRFFLLFLPSVLSVLFVFLIIKEIYNKKAALISSLIFSVLWIHLFYSMRLLTETPALLFSLISLYFFVLSYKSDFKLKPFIISILFMAFSIITRYPFAIIGFCYILFIILTGRIKFFKKKSFLIGGFLGAIPLIVFLAYNLMAKGSLLPAVSDYSAGFAQMTSFAFYVLNYIPAYLQTVFFILFLIGLIFLVLELAIGFGTIKKDNRLQSHLLIALILLSTLIFFIFITKAAEDRYIFMAIIPMLYLSSIGLILIYDFLKKYSSLLAIVIIIAVLVFGVYQQLQYSDSLIKSKIDSYSQKKDAALWIKDNVKPDEKIVSAYYFNLYTMYYADRVPIEIAPNQTGFEKQIADLKPFYLVVHAFESQPEYIYTYPEQHPDIFKIEKVWMFDAQHPAVVVYKVG